MGASVSVIKDFEDLRSNKDLSADELLRNLEEKHGQIILRSLKDKYAVGKNY